MPLFRGFPLLLLNQEPPRSSSDGEQQINGLIEFGYVFDSASQMPAFEATVTTL